MATVAQGVKARLQVRDRESALVFICDGADGAASCKIQQDDEMPAWRQRSIAGGDACATKVLAIL